MKLTNWSIVSRTANPFQAPELGTQCLYGNVYNNPKFEDNQDVTTSRIIGKRNGKVVTRSGSEYELDGVDPIYEAAYPDAFNRLMNTLDEI